MSTTTNSKTLSQSNLICPDCGGNLKLCNDYITCTTGGYPSNVTIYQCVCEKCLASWELWCEDNIVHTQRLFFG